MNNRIKPSSTSSLMTLTISEKERRRAGSLVPVIRDLPEYEAFKITSEEVLRIALLLGMGHLEQRFHEQLASRQESNTTKG